MYKTFSQTNIQLYNQMIDAGYNQRDLLLVKNSYELCTKIYVGLYRGSGKTLLSHVIGTASIVVWLMRPAETIAAALLHAAYADGDFGSNNPEKLIASSSNTKVNEIVRAYDNFKWSYSDEQIRDVIEQVASFSDAQKEASLLRIVNELEEYLDYAPHFHGFENDEGVKKGFQWRISYMDTIEEPLRKLSVALGYGQLADEIHKRFALVRVHKVDSSLRSGNTHMYFQRPLSYRITILGRYRNARKLFKKVRNVGFKKAAQKYLKRAKTG